LTSAKYLKEMIDRQKRERPCNGTIKGKTNKSILGIDASGFLILFLGIEESTSG
jgi:hypothetical protein